MAPASPFTASSLTKISWVLWLRCAAIGPYKNRVRFWYYYIIWVTCSWKRCMCEARVHDSSNEVLLAVLVFVGLSYKLISCWKLVLLFAFSSCFGKALGCDRFSRFPRPPKNTNGGTSLLYWPVWHLCNLLVRWQLSNRRFESISYYNNQSKIISLKIIIYVKVKFTLCLGIFFIDIQSLDCISKYCNVTAGVLLGSFKSHETDRKSIYLHIK